MGNIKRIKHKYLNKINKLEKSISKLTDEQLKAKTLEFKQKIQNNISLEILLPEVFAVVRESSKRVLNMRPYDVQLIGGIVLHEGKIAEMHTGEGKTLVAAAPVYLNALSGKSVHVVTVNDYLAKRDMSILKPLYEFLGLSVDCIVNETPPNLRKEIYKKDVIYITNAELGFDYLKDNMVKNINDKLQSKDFSFCIIDEIDSILIDEARTPLIVSSSSKNATDLYSICDIFVKHLSKDDFECDKQLKLVMFTESGTNKVEKFFHIKNYSDIENTLLRHHLEQSLKANYDMKKDKEYIIRDNNILLIDEHTGRIADGRRLSNGLHQALEAKEGLVIHEESITLASITYQNFFKLYNKYSGMTGTAKTEEKEFKETYDLNVVVIPSNKKILRKDNDDLIYVTENAKNKAIIKDIKECYKIGRPVLVGTLDIVKSEQLSQLLKKENIPHKLLNAKQNELEAKIVEKAGEKYAITIATNMAGRGTDIKLTDETRMLGGLKIIASERASNRRIDNQLKGRSGRQGDPGESQFYLSFDDELITYINESKKEKIRKLNKDNDSAIENKVFNNVINNCQKKIESKHFSIRKETTKYDKILNNQRESIYSQRDYVLNNNCDELIIKMIDDVFTKLVKSNSFDNLLLILKKEFDINEKLIESLNVNYPNRNIELLKDYGLQEYRKYLNLHSQDKYPSNTDTTPLKNIILTLVDTYWIKHLIDMTELKQDVKLMSYRGEDPIKIYIKSAYKLFNLMNFNIKKDIIRNLLLLMEDTKDT